MPLADVLLALVSVVVWGVNFVVIKIGLHGLPPFFFSALRFLLAAFPLILFVRRPRVRFSLVLAFGLCQFAFQFSLLFLGIHLGLAAGLASLVIQLQAFFTIALAILVLGERPRWYQVSGALIALTGMSVVAMNLDSGATLLGFACVIAAGFSWGLANIVTKRIGSVSALSLVTWGSLYATPPILLMSLCTEGWTAWQAAAARLDSTTMAAVLYQAYPSTIIGFGIWSYLMRRHPAAVIAPFSLLVPVTGMLAAAWMLGESLQWWKLLAGVLVLAGLAMNQLGWRLRARSETRGVKPGKVV